MPYSYSVSSFSYLCSRIHYQFPKFKLTQNLSCLGTFPNELFIMLSLCSFAGHFLIFTHLSSAGIQDGLYWHIRKVIRFRGW